MCTPAAANVELLRACAAKGVKAAFLTSAGYGEAGEDGRRAEAELVAARRRARASCSPAPTARASSARRSGCAPRSSRRTRRPGRIAVASQSGNFVSSFMNYARATGVGISRAVSAGNAAAVSVADYLDYFADDPATAVGLAYLEGITDGRALLDRLAGAAARKPLVLVKGGATAGGARAAASHTGALAADDKVFDGAVPGRRHHPGRHDRGGLRRRRHLRHPAGAGRAQRRRAHDGRRLGRRHRRRDHPRPRPRACCRCPPTCWRRSTPSCRPAGAATTRSTAPAARPATRSPR